jgi:hypothetical protein
MPRSLIPLVWAFTLWNAISVFFGTQIVLRAQSLSGDFLCVMMTLAIVLFGVATLEVRQPGQHRLLRFVWGFVIISGFCFALVGNFSFLPRLFHSPETAPTAKAIFWEEIQSERGIFIVVFTVICSIFAALHGYLPRPQRSGNQFRFFRREPPPA